MFESAGIYAPYWENSTAIVFTRTQGQDGARVFRLRIDSGEMESLTDGSHAVRPDLTHPSFALRGKSIVFISERTEPWAPLDRYPVAPIRGKDLQQMLRGTGKSVRTIYASYQGHRPQAIASVRGDDQFWLTQVSPDQKWVVLIYPLGSESIPEGWFNYEIRPKSGYRFMLVNLQSGAARPFFDAPAGTVTQAGQNRAIPFDAFWSSDSQSVLLFNTALPLNNDVAERRVMSYVVDYRVESGQWSILAPMAKSGERLRAAHWLKEGKELLITYERDRKKIGRASRFVFADGRWWVREQESHDDMGFDDERLLPGDLAPSSMRALGAGSFPTGFAAHVRQSANDPPTMVAVTASGSLDLSAPDRTLQGVRRARVEVVEWQEPGVGTRTGLLRLPRDFSTAKPVPLVIQIGEGASPAEFRPDGASFGGFAAEALTAQGFSVLQMDAYDEPSMLLTPREGPRIVEKIDAAVEALVSRGIVDPTKVALVGFSRSGYYAYYVVTHPGRTRIAAAVVFDSITASYGEYVIDGAVNPRQMGSVYEQQYGKGIFWDNKLSWMDAPAFNLDRCSTPVLFSAAGDAPYGALETVGAFRYIGLPFEYLYFPRGAHDLQTPRQRLEAMQATLDWLNFWLLGKENVPASAGTDRFEHWRTMKLAWEQRRNQSTVLPP